MADDHDNDDNEHEVDWIEDELPATTKTKVSIFNSDNNDGVKAANDNNGNDHDEKEEIVEDLGAHLFQDIDPYGDFVVRLESSNTLVDIDKYDRADNENQQQRQDDSDYLGGIKRLSKPITVTVRGKKPRMPQFLASTGLTLWEGSRVLAQYLYDHHDTIVNRFITVNDKTNPPSPSTSTISVVELGAGLGVCGIALYRILVELRYQEQQEQQQQQQQSSRCPIPYVVLTDGDTATLRNMRENVGLNTRESVVADNTRFSSNKAEGDYVSDKPSSPDRRQPEQRLPHLSCRQLLWGKEFVDDFCSRYGPPPSSSSSSSSSSFRTFDIVMAADVVYGQENLPPLMETVAGLLGSTNTPNKDQSSLVVEDNEEPVDNDYVVEPTTLGHNSNNGSTARDGIFILSYVFRTVPIESVVQCALSHGLICIERPQSNESNTSQSPSEENENGETSININGIYVFCREQDSRTT